MKKFVTIEDLPECINAQELGHFLRISRVSSYNLLKSETFPTLRIGKRLFVTKPQLIKWINRNTREIDKGGE